MLKALRASTTIGSQLFVTRLASPSFVSGVRIHDARSYATETALPSASSTNPVTSVGNPEGLLRPHLGVEVNPNHGLWAFFRRKVGQDGAQSYETLEKKDNAIHYSGRAWSAAELRRKSFKDLHTLWYVVVRERNLLETQALEAKRLGVMLEFTPIQQRVFRCRKTMARIKYVINERRLAYEGAVQIAAEGNEHGGNQTALREEGLEKEQANISEPSDVEGVEEPTEVPHQTAAERAAAGLLPPDVVRK